MIESMYHRSLRRWSREAFRMYDRNQEEFNRNGVYQEDVRLDYINYMVRYGQYEEER